jgi:hypothetical protein
MTTRRPTDGAPMVTDGASAPTKSKRRYTRHGYHTLRAKVAARGLAALDTRTAGAKALLAWRGDLYAALGGQDAVTPQERMLIEGVVRQQLYADHLDAQLMSLRGGIGGPRRKVALPLLRERRALQDSISRMLAQLGLERRAKPVQPLHEMLAEIARQDQERAAEATGAADSGAEATTEPGA